MAFTENSESIQRELRLNGFVAVREPFDLSSLEKETAVVDCEVIARKSYYNILYMEVESNWKGIATDVAKNNPNPCLVVTNYKHSRLILTTLKDHIISRTPRHVVIDSNSKTHTFQKFCKLIKVKPEDEINDIDDKIQSAFDDYSEYAEALREFGDNLESIIKTTTQLIESKIAGNKRYEREANKLLKVCQKIINDQMVLDDIKDMLIQHVLTYRIFALVYDEQDFDHKNTVAKSLETLKEILGLHDEKINYGAMEIISESITDTDQKQEFLKKIYETFYEKHDAKKADKDGIVYTPTEVVKFIVLSVNELLQKNFGKGISDKDVTILDPFTGTGTFLVHLLREIDPKKLDSKYTKEIHANEISILPYYVATLNIENTYNELTGKYKEFENICWMDTFDSGIKNYDKITEHLGLADNIKRITRQQKSEIHVIIGNPPYSMGQSNFNDQNQNMKYPDLDKRIENTYLKRTKEINPNIGLTTSIRDSYIRSLRWAGDRIGNSGIIGFVTNAGFIRSDSGSGVRASLHEEFTDIYCFDLRGNARTQGEIRKKEAGTVFDSGSRAPVAITILVKNPKKKKHTIHYKDIGDYLSREDKLKTIYNYTSIQGIKDWQTITPDKHHDWLGQRSDEFERYVAMGSKETKSGKTNDSIFKLYSSGIKTHRDVWVYNSSQDVLSKNMTRTIEYCNNQNLNKPILDPKFVKWSPGLTEKLKKLKPKFDKNKIQLLLYRPFFKQYLYYDKTFNEVLSLMPKFFPKENSENLAIIVPYKYKGNSSTFITNITPDLEVIHHGQCFPLFTYENGSKQINITDYILNQYQNRYKDKTITKEDIFYYTYGFLHHEGYKKKFTNNLQKELPRIPMAPNFKKFVTAGRRLADLHLNYETCEKYTLKPKAKFGDLKSMAFSKVKKNDKLVQDKTRLKINDIEVFDLPEIKYTVNGRTPIEWAIDRYKYKVDKDSGIVNDSTVDLTEKKTIEMIQRLTYVAVESDKIIKELSEEEFEPSEGCWNPEPTDDGLDKFTNPSEYQSKL